MGPAHRARGRSDVSDACKQEVCKQAVCKQAVCLSACRQAVQRLGTNRGYSDACKQAVCKQAVCLSASDACKQSACKQSACLPATSGCKQSKTPRQSRIRLYRPNPSRFLHVPVAESCQQPLAGRGAEGPSELRTFEDPAATCREVPETGPDRGCSWGAWGVRKPQAAAGGLVPAQFLCVPGRQSKDSEPVEEHSWELRKPQAAAQRDQASCEPCQRRRTAAWGTATRTLGVHRTECVAGSVSPGACQECVAGSVSPAVCHWECVAGSVLPGVCHRAPGVTPSGSDWRTTGLWSAKLQLELCSCVEQIERNRRSPSPPLCAETQNDKAVLRPGFQARGCAECTAVPALLERLQRQLRSGLRAFRRLVTALAARRADESGRPTRSWWWVGGWGGGA